MNTLQQHEAFLNAIIASPDDDLPRLVFADFLEETGDSERAEFIRVQCELAGGVADAGRMRALETREKELLKRYLEAWRIPIRGHQTFERGFVDSLWTTASLLLDAPAEQITDSTVRTLRITNADKSYDRLAEYTGFARIEHLDLTNNSLAGDYRLRAILNNPHLGKLRGLNLHNNRIWADDVLRIARSPVATQLTHLDLSGNGIGNEGVGHLASEVAFANIEVLILRSDGLPEYECIDREGAHQFMKRPSNFQHLIKLDLEGHHITEEGIVCLFLGLLRGRLEYLNIARNRLGNGSGGFEKALFGTHEVRSSLRVDFCNNALSEREANYLLSWGRLADIGQFRLTGCDMTDETRAMLLTSPHAAKFHLDGDAS